MKQYITKRNIIIAALLILIILALFIWWLWFNSNRSLNPNTIDRVTVQTPTVSVATTSEPTIAYRPGDELTVVARNAIERYGSYSNQTAGQNIEDIRSLITADLYRRLSSIQQPVTEGYQGVDTKVLSSKVISQSTSNAVLEVSTQRSERKDDLTVTIRYQKATVGLSAVGDGWLVNSIQWQ